MWRIGLGRKSRGRASPNQNTRFEAEQVRLRTTLFSSKETAAAGNWMKGYGLKRVKHERQTEPGSFLNCRVYYCYNLILCFNSIHRAEGRTGAAVDACVADNKFAITFGNRVNRALRLARTATDAFLGYSIHCKSSLNVTGNVPLYALYCNLIGKKMQYPNPLIIFGEALRLFPSHDHALGRPFSLSR